MVGHITNTVEYQVTYFSETYDKFLSDYLNQIGQQGWFLHSIHRTEIEYKVNDEKVKQISYECIWQKISQSIGGIIK